MNDNHAVGAVRDSLATARDSLTEVHMSRPLEAIVQRGRARRRRHRLTGIAGAAAVAVGAALAVTALALGGHHPSTQLAAWTVAKQADGNIMVTIRELRDPAGLQSTLRADGVPASVRFSPARGQPNPCQAYDGSQRLYHKVLQDMRPGNLRGQSTIVIIHPSALPPGAAVGLQVSTAAGYVHRPGLHQLGIALVQASPRCTGS
jgi:hypothetical protein